MSRTGGLGRRLRLGMVGGGAGSLIGDSHRIPSRMDDCYELAAGAFDIDPERGRAFARDLGLPAERAYGTWREMRGGGRGRLASLRAGPVRSRTTRM